MDISKTIYDKTIGTPIIDKFRVYIAVKPKNSSISISLENQKKSGRRYKKKRLRINQKIRAIKHENEIHKIIYWLPRLIINTVATFHKLSFEGNSFKYLLKANTHFYLWRTTRRKVEALELGISVSIAITFLAQSALAPILHDANHIAHHGALLIKELSKDGINFNNVGILAIKITIRVGSIFRRFCPQLHIYVLVAKAAEGVFDGTKIIYQAETISKTVLLQACAKLIPATCRTYQAIILTRVFHINYTDFESKF